MSPDALVEATRRWVEARFSGEGTGHDWWHVKRVWRLARHLAAEEGAEGLVVELAALLHDVDDWKLGGADDGAQTRRFLAEQGADPALVDRVVDVVTRVSYKGAGVADDVPTLEARVVQDADRLDAIGAVGIARAFAFGGARSRPLHDPDAPPVLHATPEAYRSARGSTVNHFHEKLLLLADRLHTPAARSIAAERHAFMVRFLEQFEAEWSLQDV